MNSRRSSVNALEDYPEHLNPFNDEDHKSKFWKQTSSKPTRRSNSFSSTLKDIPFISAIRKSFRRKSKSEKNGKTNKSKGSSPPIIRKHESATLYTGTRQTIGSYHPRTPQYSYPRSRFSERLTKEQLNADTISICSTTTNPFDEDEDLVRKPSPKGPLSPRKKKAPPPPVIPSSSVLHLSTTNSVNIGTDSNDSQSADQTINQNEDNSNFGSSQNIITQLQHLTVELQKLTDNSNSNDDFIKNNHENEQKEQEQTLMNYEESAEHIMVNDIAIEEVTIATGIDKMQNQEAEDEENNINFNLKQLQGSTDDLQLTIKNDVKNEVIDEMQYETTENNADITDSELNKTQSIEDSGLSTKHDVKEGVIDEMQYEKTANNADITGSELNKPQSVDDSGLSRTNDVKEGVIDEMQCEKTAKNADNTGSELNKSESVEDSGLSTINDVKGGVIDEMQYEKTASNAVITSSELNKPQSVDDSGLSTKNDEVIKIELEDAENNINCILQENEGVIKNPTNVDHSQNASHCTEAHPISNMVTLAEPEKYEDFSDESISEYAESYFMNENPIYNPSAVTVPHKKSQLNCNDVANSAENNTTEDEMTSEAPVPKLRKSKLTKNILLGQIDH